ncbi:MAG: M28 family peptidase [Verrucomicrobiota bacterium]
MRPFFSAALAAALMGAFGTGEVRAAATEFSGEKALAHVQRLVELGPRPAGSDVIEKARTYISDQLAGAGWKVQRQTFTDKTPNGVITFVNLVATFGGQAAPDFLLCSHYDTKLFDSFSFVGANDGGSSTGLLLELARVLAAEPALAAKLELVFFDGEEAFEEFSATDGIYGSRYFAHELKASGEVKKFHGGILFDMVGDKSLTVTMPPDSPAELARGIFAAADRLKLRDHFTYFASNITDDHTPLNAIGLPVIDLIDFDYPPWHTVEDTMDKISAESLRIVGEVALSFLRAR